MSYSGHARPGYAIDLIRPACWRPDGPPVRRPCPVLSHHASQFPAATKPQTGHFAVGWQEAYRSARAQPSAGGYSSDPAPRRPDPAPSYRCPLCGGDHPATEDFRLTLLRITSWSWPLRTAMRIRRTYLTALATAPAAAAAILAAVIASSPHVQLGSAPTHNAPLDRDVDHVWHVDVRDVKVVVAGHARDVLNANPQVQTDLQGIRQPLVDFKAGCQ